MIFAGASSPGRRGGSLPYWRYFRPNTKATMAKAAMVAAKIMLATVNSMKIAITRTPITGEALPVKPHTK